jgi:hypothetical protein
MQDILDKIRNGINFEEELIGYLTNEISQAEELTSLDEVKRKKLLLLLQVLTDDSIRHKQLLTILLKKY